MAGCQTPRMQENSHSPPWRPSSPGSGKDQRLPARHGVNQPRAPHQGLDREPSPLRSPAISGDGARASARHGKALVKPSMPLTAKIRRRLGLEMTSRSSPPSASARLCARTSTFRPAESQKCVRDMSTSSKRPPFAAAASREARSSLALVISISSGALTTGNAACKADREADLGHSYTPASGTTLRYDRSYGPAHSQDARRARVMSTYS